MKYLLAALALTLVVAAPVSANHASPSIASVSPDPVALGSPVTFTAAGIPAHPHKGYSYFFWAGCSNASSPGASGHLAVTADSPSASWTPNVAGTCEVGLYLQIVGSNRLGPTLEIGRIDSAQFNVN